MSRRPILPPRAYAVLEMYLDGYDPDDWGVEPTLLGLGDPSAVGAVPTVLMDDETGGHA